MTMPVQRPGGSQGSALIIVLAFVILLTIVVLAFLSRSISNGLISDASSNRTRAELYARGAIDQIMGDLRQEIAAGSLTIATDAGGGTIYRPLTTWNEVPYNSGPASYGNNGASSALWNDPIKGFPNLVKQSASGVPFYTTANSTFPVQFDPNFPLPAPRASNVSTVIDTAYINPSSVGGTSRNGRYLSPALWNQALLLPKKTPTNTDTTPITGFIAPDWILTATDGSNPTTWNPGTMASPQGSQYVVGRYAYTIYNEGGLLDANVAGSPGPGSLGGGANSFGGPSQQTTWSRKGAQAFADLTQLTTTAAAQGVTFPQTVVDQLVGWRNYATAGSPNTGFPALLALTSPQTDNYFAYLLGISTQFLTPSNNTSNSQTDLRFTNRQQMLSFFNDAVATADQASMQNAMMYFTHYSRALNQPSYWPDPNTSRPRVVTGQGTAINPGDDVYNPPFKKITVTTTFTRTDGTTAVVGEPLVKKRFALNRLIWLTYKGPSASVPTSDALYTQYQKLLPPALLSQLWAEGTALNIQKYFGLNWHAGSVAGGAGGWWTYDVHNTGTHVNSIATLQQVESDLREPDFFELLQATICRGSLGATLPTISTATQSATIAQLTLDAQVDYQIFQMGVDMIDQVSPDDFPTNIVFVDNIGPNAPSPNPHPFWGKKDLPYLSGIGNIALLSPTSLPNPPPTVPPTAVSSPIVSPGQESILAIPLIWNPCTLPSTPLPASLSPAHTQLRIVAYNFSSYFPNTPGGYDIGVNYNNSASTVYFGQFQAPVPWPQGTLVANNGWVVGSGNTPEPTPSTALILNNATSYREPTPLFRTNVASIPNAKASGFGRGVLGLPDFGDTGDLFLGFLLSQGPVLFSATVAPSTTQQTYTLTEIDQSQVTQGLTYCLQYQIGGSWFPYEQYTLVPEFAGFYSQYNDDNNPTGARGAGYTQTVLQSWPAAGWTANPSLTDNDERMAQVFDPRTMRWGTSKDHYFKPFLDAAQTMTGTIRIDGNPSFDFFDNVGMATQNLASVSGAVKDPDGVIRRAMGAYVPTNAGGVSTTTAGLPMATAPPIGPAINASNRPIILHRPFQSVAELGYVFRGTPWKNIDFFTPESGDAALLDVFCINEDTRLDAVREGQIDLNTKQIPVLQALLAGVYRDELDPATNPALSSTEATAVATALVTRTEGSTVNQGPLLNIAELVGHYVKSPYVNTYGQPYDGFTSDLGIYTGGSSPANNTVQRFRETTMRGLSDAGQAGTWNLMIDLVAQSGRYPINASGLADFLVEGERHYWIHVAIDRTTDQIIDENIEPVSQ